MGLDDRLADRQPQPQPAELPGDRVLPLLEGVEDPGQGLRLDADAGVGHLDDQPAVLVPRAEGDRARPRA